MKRPPASYHLPTVNGRLPTAALLAAVLALGAAASAPTHAQNDLVARVSAYVDSYLKQLGSVVAEERYEQRVARVAVATTTTRRTDGGPLEAVLVSDFLLVEVPGEGWLPFRDVFEVNGKPVRDRQDRLAALFLNGTSRSAFEQARRIMSEGARYNIGNVQRNINLPTLAIPLLGSRYRRNFRVRIGRRDDAGTVLEFDETARPTYIATTAGRDLPIRGKFWVNDVTGAVHRTEIEAVDTGITAFIGTAYRRDDALGLLVPERMDERYRRAGDSQQILGTATYSNFRRFSVTTSEDVGPVQ